MCEDALVRMVDVIIAEFRKEHRSQKRGFFSFRGKSDDRVKRDEFNQETRCRGKKVSGSKEKVIRTERRDLHCSPGSLATHRMKWENGKS